MTENNEKVGHVKCGDEGIGERGVQITATVHDGWGDEGLPSLPDEETQLRDRIISNLEADVSDLNHYIKDRDSDIEYLLQLTVRAHKRYVSMRERVCELQKELKEEIESKDEIVKDTKGYNDTLVFNITKLREDYKREQEKVEKLNIRNDDLVYANSELKKIIKQEEENVAHQLQESVNLEKELEIEVKRNKDYAKKNKELNERVEQYQHTIEKLVEARK